MGTTKRKKETNSYGELPGGARVTDELTDRIGQDTCLHWRDDNNHWQSAAGVIVQVQDGWVLLDWGYGISISVIKVVGNPEKCIEDNHEPNDLPKLEFPEVQG